MPSVMFPTTRASSMKLGAQKASDPVKKVSAVKPSVIIMKVLFVIRYSRSSAYADQVAVFCGDKGHPLNRSANFCHSHERK